MAFRDFQETIVAAIRSIWQRIWGIISLIWLDQLHVPMPPLFVFCQNHWELCMVPRITCVSLASYVSLCIIFFFNWVTLAMNRLEHCHNYIIQSSLVIQFETINIESRPKHHQFHGIPIFYVSREEPQLDKERLSGLLFRVVDTGWRALILISEL